MPLAGMDDLRDAGPHSAGSLQDETEATEHLWAAACNATGDSMAILDGDGRIVAANRAWLQACTEQGSTLRDGEIGRIYLDVCDRATTTSHGSTASQGIRRVLDGTEDTFHLEYSCNATEMTRRFAMRAAAFERGQPPERHVLVTHRDETRRYRAERDLRASEGRWRTLAQNAPIFFYLLDGDGQIEFVNRPPIGFTLDEVVDHDVRDFVHHEDRARYQQALDAANRGKAGMCEVRSSKGVWYSVRLAHVGQGADDSCIVGVAWEITALKQQEQMRDRFVSSVLEAQEHERRRLARELHDQTSQSLVAILVALDRIEETHDSDQLQERVQRARTSVQQTLDEIGRVTRGLHPAVLDKLGFLAALEHQAEEFGRVHGIEVETSFDSRLHGECLLRPIELTIYRIVQEALTNVAKHAAASRVSVVVRRRENGARVLVEDDGCGFDPDATHPSAAGLGVYGMRERAAVIGARLSIESQVGRGTTIVLDIPREDGDPR